MEQTNDQAGEKCENCHKTFKNLRLLFKHRSQECRPKTCPVCFQIFSKSKYYEEHIKKQKIRCNHCNKDFCDESTFQRHIRSLRNITDDTIRDLNQRIYPETGYENEDGYQEVIENKFNEIRDRTKNTKHYKIINRQIDPSFTYSEIDKSLLDFYADHKNGFKINLGLGYILYHTISEIYKYHYVSTNNLFRKSCCNN